MPPKRAAALKASENLTELPDKKLTAAESAAEKIPVNKKQKVIKSEESKEPETTAGKLAVGQQLKEDLTVTSNDSTEHNLAQLASESDKGIVVFFYPKANTPGCTNQACGFRDNYEDVTSKYGFKVYGMSADSCKSQTTWQTKHQLPYPLLSDLSKDRHVLKYLGVDKGGKSVTRSHIIIGKDGKVLNVSIGVSPKESVESAVDFVKNFAPAGDEEQK